MATDMDGFIQKTFNAKMEEKETIIAHSIKVSGHMKMNANL